MRRYSIRIEIIPSVATFRVESKENIAPIEIVFNQRLNHITVLNTGHNEPLQVHKGQIEDLCQALVDCKAMFKELEKRQAAEEETSDEGCDQEN